MKKNIGRLSTARESKVGQTEFLTYDRAANNGEREEFIKDCLYYLGDYYETRILHLTEVEFDVHKSDGLVVAHVKKLGEHRIKRMGIAKLRDGEAFNEWIGKALALQKALGERYLESKKVPQPDKLTEGMEVQFFDDSGTLTKEGVVESIFSDDNPVVLGDGYKNYTNDGHAVAYPTKYKIIDDTNIFYAYTMSECGFERVEGLGFVYIGSRGPKI